MTLVFLCVCVCLCLSLHVLLAHGLTTTTKVGFQMDSTMADAIELCNQNDNFPLTKLSDLDAIAEAIATARGQDIGVQYHLPPNRVYICGKYGKIPGVAFIEGVPRPLNVVDRHNFFRLLEKLYPINKNFIWALDSHGNFVVSPMFKVPAEYTARISTEHELPRETLKTFEEYKHGDLLPGETPWNRPKRAVEPRNPEATDYLEYHHSGAFRGLARLGGELLLTELGRWVLNNRSGFSLARLTTSLAQTLTHFKTAKTVSTQTGQIAMIRLICYLRSLDLSFEAVELKYGSLVNCAPAESDTTPESVMEDSDKTVNQKVHRRAISAPPTSADSVVDDHFGLVITDEPDYEPVTEPISQQKISGLSSAAERAEKAEPDDELDPELSSKIPAPEPQFDSSNLEPSFEPSPEMVESADKVKDDEEPTLESTQAPVQSSGSPPVLSLFSFASEDIGQERQFLSEQVEQCFGRVHHSSSNVRKEMEMWLSHLMTAYGKASQKHLKAQTKTAKGILEQMVLLLQQDKSFEEVVSLWDAFSNVITLMNLEKVS